MWLKWTECNLFLWWQSWIFSIITAVFSVTWSSEIILIFWFAAQDKFIIINVKNSTAANFRNGNTFSTGFFDVYKVQKNSIYWKFKYFLTFKVKVQGFFICHMINYTGYNQKWNVVQIRSAQWTVQRIKKKENIYIKNKQ